jgi:PKD repeat protein
MTEVSFTGYNATYSDMIPVVDFTASTTSGPAPLYVMFNDNSTNEVPGSTTYSWEITPASGVSAGATGTMENHAASFSVPGNYTVSHNVTTPYGSGNMTKNNYITVYNSTTDYITTHFVVLDEPRWFQLAGSTINMKDVENNSWVNVSPSATGYEGITTLSNHTINAYASMTGYGDEELLAKPAWSGGDYQLLMFPDGYANVSAGNVTVYCTVFGSDVFRLSGATVNMAYADPVQGQINDYRITDDSGMVSFVVPNKTVIYFYASKAGYKDGGTSVNSGTGSGGSASVYTDVTLQRSTVTTAPTATTLPGGGTPTATAATVDPYPCVGDGSYQDTLNCQRKQGEMGADAIEYANMLIPLFVLATIVGTLKIMGK